jgi:hypothetical protein
MSRRSFTRREFERMLGLAGLAAAGGCSGERRSARSAFTDAAASAEAPSRFRATRGGVDLGIPPSTPQGQVWRYGLAYPFQVAARTAALFCNIRGNRGHDFEVGTDVVVFRDAAAIGADRGVAVSRNHEEGNPRSHPPGKPSIMVKFPLSGGFVPLGAKRPDGSNHPHAGTGYGFCAVEAWPRHADRPYAESEYHEYLEVQQYAFDDAGFRVHGTERVATTDLIPGWRIEHPGVSHAVADGDDFVQAVCGSAEKSTTGSGVVRWRRRGGRWQPVSFVPIEEFDNAHGPSLVRDVDGSLIFCAAGTFGTDYDNDIRMWRSRDGGAGWQPLLHVRHAIASAPHSVNRAADGTPYVAATLYQVFVHPAVDAFRRRKDPQGRLRGGGRNRERICIWPLREDRTDLETAILVRDGRVDFGAPPSGSSWFVDHPSAMTVHLGDGRWHDLLAYRICDGAEVLSGAPPAPQTGTYVEEITSTGKVLPLWRF